ncbi:hypothetical protein BDV95DRAFT_605179 [Massariosphaeria phaeospora]|uniref:Nudix hydrolase domain-containing protein n=1 Tax=Massariosphaeria phaeospora TaxID=100035 RepID=A0A7C8MBJ7_9PLEO|nr:hypothetical protein BDV95DRAFT_605179 [Massariosphaeria phaeospora]
MTDNMQLVDWLDDLCVRFIINLPHEELLSVERICFQIEEAQWFYEDFIRPLDPSLPSLNLRRFALLMFQHCPLSSTYSELHHTQAYEDFLAYKTRVPVRGAIMLNDDMTHAVLVKGWKKGAKWSFPRGKINKEEADLDCAVREVYEETGYDLHEAQLVGRDEDMKKIPMNMREQSMLLYVFRGVPMDTYFAPRTRKEISKIDWYKLTDLPTLKRRQQAQGNGHDLVKDNSFYMVAPFLGPLKAWIKLQRKLDRQKPQTEAQLAPPVAAEVIDAEEIEPDVGEITADEVPIPGVQPSDPSFAELVAMLERGHRPSDTLPEVTAHYQAQEIMDPAAELKRLLSVGAASPLQSPPVEAPAVIQESQTNPLMAMLQAGNRPPPHTGSLPHTPFEQVLPTPPLPQSPHGQHYPRPPQFDHMGSPPPFHFPGQQALPFRGPPPPHMRHPGYNAMPMPIPRQFVPPPPRQGPLMYPPEASHMHDPYNQQGPRPYQRTGDPQFAHGSQFPGPHGPAIPPASKLPAPHLTAHTLGLLNTFKMNEKPAPQAPEAPQAPPQPSRSQTTPSIPQAATVQPYDSILSQQGLQRTNTFGPGTPTFQSPPPNANFQPVQPKPRSAHQDSLLSLFRSPSVSAVTPPPQKLLPEPAELSALPTTPGDVKLVSTTREAGPPLLNLTVKPNQLDAFGQQLNKAGVTSATVRGPVNAPDFETVKKNTHLSGMNGQGHSRGPSPAEHKSVEQTGFVPQQILRREDTARSPTDMGGAPSAKAKAEKPAPLQQSQPPQQSVFQPKILQRPQQSSPSPLPTPTAHSQALLEMFKSQTSPPPVPAPATRGSPAPLAPNSFDRRDSQPSGQKNALLSLFNQVSQGPSAPAPTATARSPLPRSPLPHTRSPRPPTPKTQVSGIISPVSPLPDRASQQTSPAHLASRSRISSIGDTIPPNIISPQNAPAINHPITAIKTNQKNGLDRIEDGYISTGSVGALNVVDKGKGKASADGRSPVDKNFLLGFLEDVARRGR